MAWLQQESGKSVPPVLLEFSGGAPLKALEYADGRFDALNQHTQKSLRDLLSGDADVTQVAAEWGKGRAHRPAGAGSICGCPALARTGDCRN